MDFEIGLQKYAKLLNRKEIGNLRGF